MNFVDLMSIIIGVIMVFASIMTLCSFLKFSEEKSSKNNQEKTKVYADRISTWASIAIAAGITLAFVPSILGSLGF